MGSHYPLFILHYVQVEEETEEEESDGDDVDPKNGIFRDPSHDPFEGWHKIAGNISKEIDIKAVLLDDPDVKKVWDNQGIII